MPPTERVNKIIVIFAHQPMLMLPAQAQRYEEVERRFCCLQAHLGEGNTAAGGPSHDKEELQNLELRFYSLNRDLASIANDMACTLFSYYYQATLSKRERERAESHQ